MARKVSKAKRAAISKDIRHYYKTKGKPLRQSIAIALSINGASRKSRRSGRKGKK